MNEVTQNPELEKPSILYHASPNRGITVFHPKKESFREANEGPVVFATPDKAYAMIFLIKTDNAWTTIGRFSEAGVPGPWHIIISDRDRFEKADVGGTLYEFDPKDFSYDKKRNMGNIEWTSQNPVKPIRKEDYPSGLEAMKSAGINVYFVDEATFNVIRHANDDGKSIINTLTLEA